MLFSSRNFGCANSTDSERQNIALPEVACCGQDAASLRDIIDHMVQHTLKEVQQQHWTLLGRKTVSALTSDVLREREHKQRDSSTTDPLTATRQTFSHPVSKKIKNKDVQSPCARPSRWFLKQDLKPTQGAIGTPHRSRPGASGKPGGSRAPSRTRSKQHPSRRRAAGELELAAKKIFSAARIVPPSPTAWDTGSACRAGDACSASCWRPALLVARSLLLYL